MTNPFAPFYPIFICREAKSSITGIEHFVSPDKYTVYDPRVNALARLKITCRCAETDKYLCNPTLFFPSFLLSLLRRLAQNVFINGCNRN